MSVRVLEAGEALMLLKDLIVGATVDISLLGLHRWLRKRREAGGPLNRDLQVRRALAYAALAVTAPGSPRSSFPLERGKLGLLEELGA